MRRLPFLVTLILLSFTAPAAANIYRWDNGELITEKDAEPGADLGRMDLSYADLENASLFGASFGKSDLTYAHLMSADLTLGFFREATLTGANLSGADLTNALFAEPDIGTPAADLTDVDLSGANLMCASFTNGFDATLNGADLSFADLRKATILESQMNAATSTHNSIRRDGHVDGLDLEAGEQLKIRDSSRCWYEWFFIDPIPIAVDHVLGLDPDATLQFIIEDNDWASTISFEPSIPVSLDGTLELMLADISPASLIGTTFDLFNWDGVTPTGTFAEITTEADAVWDTTNLYTTGEVTLISASVLLGDVNLDGEVNGLDIDPFVEMLLNGPHWPEADMNADQVVNGLDVDPFVAAVVGSGARSVPEPSTLLLCVVALGVAGGWRKWKHVA